MLLYCFQEVEIPYKGTSTPLTELGLEKGRRYWARVRVMPEGFWGNCDWSDWSPVAFWDSAIGDSPGSSVTTNHTDTITTTQYKMAPPDFQTSIGQREREG